MDTMQFLIFKDFSSRFDIYAPISVKLVAGLLAQ